MKLPIVIVMFLRTHYFFDLCGCGYWMKHFNLWSTWMLLWTAKHFVSVDFGLELHWTQDFSIAEPGISAGINDQVHATAERQSVFIFAHFVTMWSRNEAREKQSQRKQEETMFKGNLGWINESDKHISKIVTSSYARDTLESPLGSQHTLPKSPETKNVSWCFLQF